MNIIKDEVSLRLWPTLMAHDPLLLCLVHVLSAELTPTAPLGSTEHIAPDPLALVNGLVFTVLKHAALCVPMV